MVEIIPSDLSSKYRVSTPMYEVGLDYQFFSTSDLFGEGAKFTTDSVFFDAFANGDMANNGGTFDYSVTVDSYDKDAHEAVITIKNIKAS